MCNRKRYWLLYPAALLYGAVVYLRNLLFDKGFLISEEQGIPVICVGNLSVGGTGKTPHVEYLAGILKERFNVAVISRGYGRKSRGFRIVTTESPVEETGDEPLQIALRHPEITVAVDGNRRRGIAGILRSTPSTDVVIMDDGFQHRRVKPGLSVVLTRYNNLFTDDILLPCGTLREQRRGIGRADIVVVTGAPPTITTEEAARISASAAQNSSLKVFFTTPVYDRPQPLFPDRCRVAAPFSGAGTPPSLLLVTGIADPSSLVNYLSGLAASIKHMRFGDHHSYRQRDFDSIAAEAKKISDRSDNYYIFTTQKDAVKLKMAKGMAPEVAERIFVIPISVTTLHDDGKQFESIITNYVQGNRRDRTVSD